MHNCPNDQIIAYVQIAHLVELGNIEPNLYQIPFDHSQSISSHAKHALNPN